MSERIIGVKTTCNHKINEISKALSLYDIKVIKIDDIKEFITEYSKMTNKKILAILTEKTRLLDKNNNEIRDNQIKHLMRVKHESKLIVLKENGDEKEYVSNVNGYIDIRKKVNNQDIYNWDDIFVVENIHKTYYELAIENNKYSARDNNISQFIKENIYYKKRIDLANNEQKYEKTIDFTKDAYQFIKDTKEYNTDDLNKTLLANIPIQACNLGLFFKSAINRRQKIYWVPGLNAFLPFTNKSDPHHELTYLFHDLTHFNIPDLVYTGNNSELHKKVYISYRLMSEAITLVVGDMLFVKSLNESNIEYKTVKKRKIYPLFELIEKKLFENKLYSEIVKELVFASYNFCFYGDLSEWKKMCDNTENTNEIFDNFSNKYTDYMLEDFNWTAKNWDFLKSNTNTNYNLWYKEITPIKEKYKLELNSIDEWISMHNIKEEDMQDNKKLCDKIFESVYNRYVKPLFEKKIDILSFEERQKIGFARYMIGQANIFFKFYKLDKYNTYDIWNIIKDTMLKDELFNVDTIDNIIDIYETYLRNLQSKQLITYDDYNTYKDIYPIFNPNYINYDNSNIYMSLKQYTEFILNK